MQRRVDWKQLSERRLDLYGHLGAWSVDGRLLFSTAVRPGRYVCYIGYQSFLGQQVGRVALTEQPVDPPLQSLALAYTEVNAACCPCDILLGDVRSFEQLSQYERRTLFKAGVSTNEQASVCEAEGATLLALTSPTASGIRAFLTCPGEYVFTFLNL